MKLARKSHRGGAIAQVPLHLARDGWHREGHELVAAPRVVAVDGVEQAEGAGLHQIVVLGATTIMTMGKRLDQRHVELDQPGARALVPTFSVRAEQAAGGRISVGAKASGREVLLGGRDLHRLSQSTLTPTLRVSDTWMRARSRGL